MTGLAVNGLSAGYRGLTVLHDVSFSVADGEALGVAGPNGAGKSTLLKALAGVLPEVRGTVRAGEVDLTRLDARRRVRAGLVLVPEGRQIIGDLSVQGNLDITLLMRGRNRRDREHRERLDRVFTLFPALRERRTVKGRQLSGGEQQMLSIGRALMCQPKIMLLDEPSQGLAFGVVDQLIDVLKALRATMTLVVAEQSQVVLDELTTRRIELRMGRLAQDDRTAPTSTAGSSTGFDGVTDIGTEEDLWSQDTHR